LMLVYINIIWILYIYLVSYLLNSLIVLGGFWKFLGIFHAHNVVCHVDIPFVLKCMPFTYLFLVFFLVSNSSTMLNESGYSGFLWLDLKHKSFIVTIKLNFYVLKMRNLKWSSPLENIYFWEF
jgi:hypothetical protein